MIEPLTAADYRLLLSLLKFAIVAPDQRERVQAWLEAKIEPVTPGQAAVEILRRRGLDETGHERN